jgi:hypothetical protein
MIRTSPTLHGSRWAVLALLVASAALAFDLGRDTCPKPAPAQTTLTQSQPQRIRRLARAGLSQRAIAERCQITRYAVRKVLA